ncbi:hypothetical protein [Bosea sp. PAMC 26642]|uniref:hypothetical protein n=1 Tax=Bosea sp. (strain PAMC 26642) TaxID=1792307 RepID=UPI0012E8A860|nr:hypothetical protein [Bosea sp. PAMC 26642]
MAQLDIRGATYRACEGDDGWFLYGWYEANWFEPSMGEFWHQACHMDHPRDQALALAFKARVDRQTPDQAAAAVQMKEASDMAWGRTVGKAVSA